ncbi:MAG TPA: CapA family protein [Burkholderiaceae bacterium]|nr:CapA family protein [Burkholderiaceae bacterium]
MLKLFLAGDVMTGRGIDQILPQPNAPHLFEDCVQSARGYVALAEQAHGPIPRPVDYAYIWGDALPELAHALPDLRIVNLETAVTKSEDAWVGKGIHYRMHPANAPCLSAARIDCCVLANNHALDWGYAGLLESLQTLHTCGIRTAGAGRNAAEAAAPAVIEVGDRARVLVYAFCTRDSGVQVDWAAAERQAGVNLLRDLSAAQVDAVARQVQAVKRPDDIVVASLHWGGNWGYAVSDQQRAFAHGLIERAGVDLVHGHSSHHAKGIEVHQGKLILYACGDFLTDYEGIRGHESYRGDLSLMYFPSIDRASGRLRELTLTPLRTRRFRLEAAAPDDVAWLLAVLNREGRDLGTRFETGADGRLVLIAA